MQNSLEAVVLLRSWLCLLAPVQLLVLVHGADVPHREAVGVPASQRGAEVVAKQVFQ